MRLVNKPMHRTARLSARTSCRSIDVVIPGAVPHPDAMAMVNGLLITFGGFGRAFGPLSLG